MDPRNSEKVTYIASLLSNGEITIERMFEPPPDFTSSGAGTLRNSQIEELEREIMIDCDWPTFIDVPR